MSKAHDFVYEEPKPTRALYHKPYYDDPLPCMGGPCTRGHFRTKLTFFQLAPVSAEIQECYLRKPNCMRLRNNYRVDLKDTAS